MKLAILKTGVKKKDLGLGEKSIESTMGNNVQKQVIKKPIVKKVVKKIPPKTF